MPSNPFKMSPANGALSRLYLSYSVPLSVRVWLGSWRKLDLPPWSSFGYALAIVLLFIFAAIWTIARSSRNYRRYRGLCQELRELQQGTYDQEFVSEEPEIEELNDMERWILGKPQATVDQLAAHPHSSAVLLP